MIAGLLRRIGLLMVAAGALLASAGVLVVALAFALYALVLPRVGPAGAAGIVAAAAAALIGLGALVLIAASRRPPEKAPVATAESVVERGIAFLRKNPALALGAAAGVGFLTIRNPAYLGAAVRSFIEGREPPAKGRR